MIRTLALAALILATPALTAPAAAQPAGDTILRPIAGTRLDVVATGEVQRVPDVALISAGVVTLAPTASAAIEQNAQRMTSVRQALRAAGIADRDIQTSSISLNPEYRYRENESPVLTGYRASNQVSVRFRDIGRTGPILDALVAQGANQINGPTLMVDEPEEAMAEARLAALSTARERAELYARQLGKRVVRILAISESGDGFPRPMPMMARAEAMDAASTKIEPGEQTLSATLSVSFELD